MQAHAKTLAPYNPDVAVPALEEVMHRFEALAAEVPRDADLYHRLAQGAAADLAPYRLPKMRVELETDAAGPDEAERAERAVISAELDGLTLGQLRERWDALMAEPDPERDARRAELDAKLNAAPPEKRIWLLHKAWLEATGWSLGSRA